MFRLLKKITEPKIFIVLASVQALSIIAYNVAIIGLEKPGELRQAWDFLIANPKGYLSALIIGIITIFIAFVLLLGLIVRIPLVDDFFDEKPYTYYHSYYKEKEVSSKILWIFVGVWVILAILSYIFLSFLGTILTLAFIGVVALVIIAFLIGYK